MVIRGIKRFAVGQQALADKIVAETRALEKLQNGAAADAMPARRAAAGRAALGHPDLHRPPEVADRWSATSRSQLEQRAFALARIIQEQPAMNRRVLLGAGAAPCWPRRPRPPTPWPTACSAPNLLAGVTAAHRAALPLRDERQGHRPALSPATSTSTCARSPRTAPSRCSSTCSRAPTSAQFGPIAAQEQNPLVLVFLQRDVTQMANLTGGAAGYFQQQIRRGVQRSAPSPSPSRWCWAIASCRVRRLVMQPVRATIRNIEPLPAVQGQVLRVHRRRRRAGRDLPLWPAGCPTRTTAT